MNENEKLFSDDSVYQNFIRRNIESNLQIGFFYTKKLYNWGLDWGNQTCGSGEVWFWISKHIRIYNSFHILRITAFWFNKQTEIYSQQIFFSNSRFLGWSLDERTQADGYGEKCVGISRCNNTNITWDYKDLDARIKLKDFSIGCSYTLQTSKLFHWDLDAENKPVGSEKHGL